ncbi:type II toxin-antitoxin system RelE/ParE family toxin [Phyllobacterium sp. LjRoot231]
MSWRVQEHPDFSKEQAKLDPDVADKLDEMILILAREGPNLGRPLVDTLYGSKHANMKEIRFALKGVWRFAFAFDPDRQAIILVGGNKEGVNQRRFYKSLVKNADKRFDEWLQAKE